MAKLVPEKNYLKIGAQSNDVKILKRYLKRFGHWRKTKGSSVNSDVFDQATIESLNLME